MLYTPRSPDWSKVPAVELEHTGWLTPCPITAKAQLCHNADTLFVRLEAQEQNIRAQLSGAAGSGVQRQLSGILLRPPER